MIYSGDFVILTKQRVVMLDGKRIPFHKNMTGKSVYSNGFEHTSNGETIKTVEIFIDGYQLVDGSWVRTLRALWHKFF